MSKDRDSSQKRQLWLLSAPGTQREGLIAEVALDKRSRQLHSFAIPAELESKVRVGVRVKVPRGRDRKKLVSGICVRISRGSWHNTLGPVLDVAADDAPLPAELLELGLWIADYYACPPGKALAALSPAAARRLPRRTVTLLQRTAKAPEGELSAKQRQLHEALAAGPKIQSELLAELGISGSVARALRGAGLVDVVRREEVVRSSRLDDLVLIDVARHCPEDDFALTPGQDAALQAISSSIAAGAFAVHLLFGIPGSGKTEVYIRAIRQAVGRGRQAIMLVPEIALTTQLTQRLARRFGRLAILHGRLTSAKRRDTWRAIAAGEVDVIIGTRSAVFAPCPRLGLIIVDEEQDGSYKNLAAPYYHARDVAIKRAQSSGLTCVLGSATPALETWYNAHERQAYQLLRLPERATGAALPKVRLIPRWSAESGANEHVLSPELRDALRKTLAAGNQAILLHNRRGYAVHLRCERCAQPITCPRCGARLVLHQAVREVRCHRCGLKAPAPNTCRDDTCGGPLVRAGHAIQRLEEELAKVTPAARLLRLDRDTMRHRDDYERALNQFEAGEADILIGTQMVAKGLDFPRVRLVGVVDADAALSLPHFRAGEQVFQLVTQVLGRAGRQEGEALAIVQCERAEAPPVSCALRMDYEAFARQELVARRHHGYPPFTRLVRLVLADARPRRAREAAEVLAPQLQALAERLQPHLRVDPPQPCIIPRLRELRRWEILIRAPRDGSLQRLLHEAADARLLWPRVERFTVDVDPLALL